MSKGEVMTLGLRDWFVVCRKLADCVKTFRI